MGISRPTAYELCNRKDFPAIRVTPRRIIIPVDGLQRWLEVLFQMLKANPNIDTVYLCMDNDAAGQAANKRISDKLFIQGIKHEILVPSLKDWNEDLLYDEQEETECQTLQL